MDFSISDKMKGVLERIDAVVARHVLPREGEMGRGFFALEPKLAEARQAVKAAGLWAPQAPVELGGMGLSLLEHGLVSERLGRSPLGHYCFGCQAPDAGNIEILHQFGTAAQKERFLRPLVSGQVRSCFAMTEPGTPGSNPTELGCRAVKDGGDYVIDGHKWFTTGADGAAFAIVMAVTNPDRAPHLRASQIIVPTDTSGFERVRNIPIMGQPGEGYFSHGEIRYVSCRVPQENRLGDEGAGFLIAQERLGPGRIHHCMRWLGICERAFDLMCQRAAARDMGGGRMLAEKQIIQGWIAECRAEIGSARWSVLHAAWVIDRAGFHAAREEVSLIKFAVADVLMHVLDRAIQVHGALGITDDTLLAHWYAHERGARIYDGPDEVHKIAAARRILSRYQPGAAGDRPD
jgi:alkylation response protein AidB-like acyl-CoA dehydrogenase